MPWFSRVSTRLPEGVACHTTEEIKLLNDSHMKNMLVIKQNIMVDSFHEPRPYKTKFWVTKECYKQLLKIPKETKMTVSNIIRMALNYVIFDETQMEKLKDKEKMSDELIYRMT
ncbi:MAG: hypothetical protein L5655_11215 [Thermosediminibacteraceae bacterium]|nr:hypothetical protein [Thermosediminibacteraceae bacterium]